MKNLLKKIALILCIFLLINSSIASADIIDDILDISTEESVDTDSKENDNAENAENNTEAEIPDNGEENAAAEMPKTEESKEKTLVFSDIEGHWAKNWIINAVNSGFVSGYEDGTFKPDRTITRAEFSKMLNGAMKIETIEQLSFTDVNDKDWFYKEVQKSVAAGFFTGYENNTFRPNNPIKREEAAKVVSGCITTGNIDGEGATRLSDYNSIQDWAKQSVNTVYNKGYILGYPEKTYLPAKALSRAEAVKIIYEIIDNENIEYVFNITNKNEYYTSTVVVGNLNILDSVGNGSVYIKNVTVLGDIVVSAKNVHTVELTDVKARNIIVESETNPIKIVCNDNVIMAGVKLPAVAVIQKLGQNINI